MQHAEIDIEVQDTVAVLRVSGELRTGPDVAPFRDHIKQQIGNGCVRVVFDLSGVTACGTPLLGALAGSYASLRNAGGDIRLIGAPSQIQEMIRVAQLEPIFRIVDSVDAAVASLQTGAQSP